MSDFIYVNILNEGSIPWIREQGPLFGYHMPISVYQILSRDPRLQMEITDYPNAKAKKEQYEAAKNVKFVEKPIEVIPEYRKPKMEEKLPIKDEVKIEVLDDEPEDSVETENIDDELDAILDEIPDTKSEIPCDIMKDESESKEFKTYTNKQLSVMTKKQLKDILMDRGYTKGPYAPKYHDHVEDLIKKVKNTQK